MVGLGMFALALASAMAAGMLYAPAAPGQAIACALLAIVLALKSAAYTIAEKE